MKRGSACAWEGGGCHLSYSTYSVSVDYVQPLMTFDIQQKGLVRNLRTKSCILSVRPAIATDVMIYKVCTHYTAVLYKVTTL